MESGGGILRNVSSLVATREDYRQVLRDHNCLQILLQHLRSHSLTIVSNACGTLWNLSARSPEDQELLWDLGAVAMLRSLIHSKHKMIAMGSAAALRNLLANRPPKYKDAAVVSPGSCTPSLYVRKQKALEAELDARRLAETFDSMERQSQKVSAPALAKSLRRMESLARDYGSDSGCCFEDDEAAPNASVSLDTASFSMLSAFLNNNAGGDSSNMPFQQHGRLQSDPQMSQPLEKDTPAMTEGLARRTPRMAAKPRTAKDDITAPTSSEDSFSLSSEDHLAVGRLGEDDQQDTSREGRAKSCSPCRLWEGSGGFTQPRFTGAQALLRLKQTNSSLSTDSLNSSGSTSDGYGGGGGGSSREQLRPAARRSVSASARKRPDRLDLKEALYGRPEKEGRRAVPPEKELRCFVPPEKDTDCTVPKKELPFITNKTSQIEMPERGWKDGQEAPTSVANEGKNAELPELTPSTKEAAGACTPPIKLSPSYQHVPLIQSMAKFGVAKTAIDVQAAQGMRRQAWVPTVLTGGALTSKLSPASCNAWSPALGQETLQRYSVENTPICFSRCSSLSSLSSADGGMEGRSQSQLENELDSDASLEIIEVEEGNLVNREEAEEEDNTLDDLSGSQPLEDDTVTKLPLVPATLSVEIPRPTRREKIFTRQEDQTPSSPSENCVQDSPLVLSRCSSVSSLGSFESPSFDSSIQSDPGSEPISGTISPSDLPDSPGQTMPPSRCKTPCCPADPGGQETQAQMGGMGMGFGMGVGSHWETGGWRRFSEIADFRERFNLPPDLDTMIYFTVERPTENFSCASSLSALPLHEHYIQKDVELKLTPLLHQRGGGNSDKLGAGAWDEQGGERPSVLDMERYSEGNSDDDIEILKECISSAMPSRFKTRTSLLASLPRPVFGSQTHRSATQLPFYMLLPTQATQKQHPTTGLPERGGSCHDDSSYSDSPMNISSTTSLSDETLRYAAKEPGVDPDVKRIEELRAFSRFHRPARTVGQPPVVSDQMNQTFRRMGPAQRAQAAAQFRGRVRLQSNLLPPRQEQIRGRAAPLLGLPVIKQNVPGCRDQKGAGKGFTQRGFQFQSRRLAAAPGHELVCCSCGDLTKVQEEEEEVVANQERMPRGKIGARNQTAQRQINISQGVKKGFPGKGKHAMIAGETSSRQSLSSSFRSLSVTSLEEGYGKTWVRNRRHATPGHAHEAARLPSGHGRYDREHERDSSPSSVSLDSEDDLLQKCITSGMPAQRKRLAAARKKKTERRQRAKTEREAAQNAFGSWDSDQDPGSEGDTASDSDLNSVEWRAIQEGARSVVMHLQAVSQSQEPSSETESESELSLMSDVSSLQSKPGAKKKGGKDNKGNGKPLEGRNAGKPLDFSQRKPVPNMPMIFRGRTVIYTPKKEPISQRPPPTKAAKNPSLAQHRSKSLHRLAQPDEEQPELFLPKRSSTPPARIPKSSSSGSTSSQSSTPLKRPQRKSSSPWPAEKPAQKAAVSSPCRGRKEAISPPCTQRSATPRPPEPKKTHKSPVRIPFMQTLPKPPSRTISPLVTSEPSGNNMGQQRRPAVSRKQAAPAGSRLNTPLRSGRAPTYNSDRSGFLRQLTFIKESPPRVSRREAVGAGGSRSVPTSQYASPRRARPAAPAVFLCSSRCQELKATGQKKQSQVQGRGLNSMQGAGLGQEQRLPGQSPTLSRATSGSDRDLSAGCPARRAGSESPCRAPQKGRVVSSTIRSSRQQESEVFKRYSSSPAINALNRTASRSSMRSSSSDSSGRAKSEAGGVARGVGRAGGVAKPGVTWRRIRDEDVPHILRSTLPSNALPLAPSPDGKNPPIPPRRTSDATVQTEDYSSKTNSSTSPTLEGNPSAKATLMRSGGGSDRANHDSPTPPSLPTEGHSGGVGHFRQSCPSRAVRVTPFNYTPSPAPSGPRDAPARPPKLTEAQEEELQAQ